MTQSKTVRVIITGRVQGVGFRYWVRSTACELGVAGWVRNCADGSVEAVYSGPSDVVERMLEASRRGPAHASVGSIRQYDCVETVTDGFQITASM